MLEDKGRCWVLHGEGSEEICISSQAGIYCMWTPQPSCPLPDSQVDFSEPLLLVSILEFGSYKHLEGLLTGAPGEEHVQTPLPNRSLESGSLQIVAQVRSGAISYNTSICSSELTFSDTGTPVGQHESNLSHSHALV